MPVQRPGFSLQDFGLAGRLVVAAVFFATAATVDDYPLALAQLFLTMLLLRLIDGSNEILHRGLRLVAWLIVPLVALHLLFTPGRLLIPALGGGPSIEGVRAAGWLSLRLALLFFAALLLLRSLRQREWLALAVQLPWLGRRLSLHVQLLPCMQRQLAELVRRYHQAWRLRGRPLWAPELLLGLLHQVLTLGRLSGAALWLRWCGGIDPVCWGSMRHGLIGALLAGLWLWLAWLA